MVKTGYISFISEIESTQDGRGNWVPGTKTQTDFLQCNLQVIKKEYIQVVDGQAQQASYSIYIDSNLVDFDLEPIKEVSIQDNRAKSLGDFQVMNVEYLELSKRIKIVV